MEIINGRNKIQINDNRISTDNPNGTVRSISTKRWDEWKFNSWFAISSCNISRYGVKFGK